jgi:hypothetical protein
VEVIARSPAEDDMARTMTIQVAVPDRVHPDADGGRFAAAVHAAVSRLVEYGRAVPADGWIALRYVTTETDGADVWQNDRYTVRVRAVDRPYLHHLAVCRNDREPARDWRDLQAIKSQLCGAENEGVELYPAESRVYDVANTTHLFVLPPGERVPTGWFGQRTVSDTAPTGGVQRPSSLVAAESAKRRVTRRRDAETY